MLSDRFGMVNMTKRQLTARLDTESRVVGWRSGPVGREPAQRFEA